MASSPPRSPGAVDPRWDWAAVKRKSASWRLMPVGERMLIVEAALCLTAARLALAILPFARYGWWLRLGSGHAPAEFPIAERIGRAVRAATRNLPWTAVCLPQAMAAKAMLARRGRSSVLCVGVVPSDGAGLSLHAWLEAGDRLITGGPRTTVVPVVRYP